ncbi:cytochrome P450 [Rhizobium sp. P40RR-XXII]|uniref:cytochrome P450 n=1 Tax=unclassified Rhizobium TaxID=2613769 RepID=UPI0039183CC7
MDEVLIMAMATPVFDPLSQAFTDDPYASYRELRARPGPVYYEHFDMWLLSRYQDVAAAAGDKTLVRSLEFFLSPEEIREQKVRQNWHDMPNHSRFVQFSLLDSDGETHDRLRRKVFREFTPALVARQRGMIQDFVDRLLDRLLQAGTFDFVEDLASRVPGHIIGSVLGVPAEYAGQLRRWSEEVVQYFDVDRSAERKATAERATTEFYELLKELIADRMRSPREDLLCRLTEAHVAGELTEDELVSTCMLILMAGHGSTIDVLGSGMHALMQYPDALAKLRETPGIMSTAIQEMFRFESPLPFFHRYLTEEKTIAGERLPKGTKVGLLYGAANRDPEQFEAPDRFNVERTPNRHLAFGGGAHFCLGNHLARLDMEIIFSTLLQRTRSIELLDENPAYKRGLSVRGPKCLDIRLVAA